MEFARHAKAICGLVLGLAAVSATAGGHDKQAAMDHSGHDMSGGDMAGHSTERDDLGRRLHGMKHNVSPEIAGELRENVYGWENVSDAEIALSMQMMGSNYQWYLSNDDVTGKTGVLILLHGFGDRGDKIFKEQLESFATAMPMSLSMGMSMMMSQHIQLGLDDLVAAGAERIIVIPVVSTEYNTMIRQWQYIFGILDEPSYAIGAARVDDRGDRVHGVRRTTIRSSPRCYSITRWNSARIRPKRS